jgi:hypothetical protein
MYAPWVRLCRMCVACRRHTPKTLFQISEKAQSTRVPRYVERCSNLSTALDALVVSTWLRHDDHGDRHHGCLTRVTESPFYPFTHVPNNFPVYVSAAELRPLSVSLYRGLTIFSVFSGMLGPSPTDDSTIFQFFFTVPILVLPRQH